jgi:hypothetical protein
MKLIIMKGIVSSLLVTVFIVLTSFGQQSSIDQVVGALRSGNAAELSKYFDDNVELSLPVKSDSYSKIVSARCRQNPEISELMYL